MKLPRHVENMIASLRGIPHDRTTSRSRPVTPIADVIDRVLARNKIKQTPIEETIMQNWRKLLGTNASRCAPESVDGSTLVVRTANPVIRQELQFHERQLVQKIQSLPGCRAIRSIRLK